MSAAAASPVQLTEKERLSLLAGGDAGDGGDQQSAAGAKTAGRPLGRHTHADGTCKKRVFAVH